MSIIDPEFLAQRRRAAQEGSSGSLLLLLLAIAGCLATAMSLGIGIAGMTGVFRYMAENGLREIRGEAPPHMVEFMVGIFGSFVAIALYLAALRRYAGDRTVRVPIVSLAFVAAAGGTVLGMDHWDEAPVYGFAFGSGGPDTGPWGWLMSTADVWLPGGFLALATLPWMFRLVRSLASNSRRRRLDRLLSVGVRCSGVVTSATSQVFGTRILSALTVRFTDPAGQSRWVRRRAVEHTETITVGTPLTVIVNRADVADERGIALIIDGTPRL